MQIWGVYVKGIRVKPEKEKPFDKNLIKSRIIHPALTNIPYKRRNKWTSDIRLCNEYNCTK